MSIGGVGRRDGEAGIMLRDIDVLEEAIGVLFRRDLSQAKLFDKTILERVKKTLDAALGLGGVGTNDLDAEFAHGASELGDRVEILKFFLDRRLSARFVDGVLVDVIG